MESYIELRADLDKLAARVALLGGSTGGANLSALGNWVQYAGVQGSPTTRQPVPGTQTGDGTHQPVVAAAVLQATYTGIFKVSVSMAWTDSGSSPSDVVQLVGVVAPSAGVLSSSGTGGFVAAGQSGASAVNPSSGVVGGDQGSSNGLLVDGTAINSLVSGTAIYPRNGTGTTPAAQGGGSGLFYWGFEGIVSAGSKTKTPYATGKNIVFALMLTIPNTNVLNIGHCAIGAVEWPFA